MPVDRAPIFAAVKHLRGDVAWDQRSVDILDRAIDTATGETSERFQTPAEQAAPPKYSLGKYSMDQLQHVKPPLRACVELAITITVQDFRVQQGLRTLVEQKAAVAAGNSRTMQSKHLLQPDGYCWAVDLVVWLNNQVSWEFNRYAAIAYAMDQAATRLGIAEHIRWGCAWDRVLSDFGGSPQAYMDEAKAYSERHAGSDLLDAPHFEWVS